MYYYLNGTVTLLEEGLAVVECGGVGYACRTTTHTLSQLRLKEPARLWTYLSVREDAMELFGFATREEKRIFEMLLGVGGVGPKAALSLLSTVPPDQLTLAVMTGNEKALTSAPGLRPAWMSATTAATSCLVNTVIRAHMATRSFGNH